MNIYHLKHYFECMEIYKHTKNTEIEVRSNCIHHILCEKRTKRLSHYKHLHKKAMCTKLNELWKRALNLLVS